MTLLIVVIVFGGMIFLHELGHFLVARLFKIEVEEFGFGLPPKVLTLFTWQGTEFTLNALPLGGFVRPKGENDPTVLDGLAAANPWKRLGVLFAGPVMNLMTAVVVLSIMVAQTGIGVPGKVLIESVSEASPAEQSGIQMKDEIVSINGQAVSTTEEARALIRTSLDQPLEMVLLRNGEKITLTATPLSNRPAEKGALGVGLGYPRRPATASEILMGGVSQTALFSTMLLSVPVMLIQGLIRPQDARLSGLKGIYDMFGVAITRDTETRQQAQQAAQTGEAAPTPTNWVLFTIAQLSISLGIFNLLPIPALDGGRILFTLPEILFRRRIPYKLENVINGVAFLLLISLMIVVNVMDFINPVNIQLP